MATIIRTADIDLSSTESNWQSLVEKYQSQVSNLPQLKNGLVAQEVANNWLVTAAKILKESELRRAIHGAKGFSEQDIRALWAHDHNEYYAKYHASEVYDLKRLESIAIPSEQDKKQIVLQSLSKALIQHKHNLTLSKLGSEAHRDTENHHWVNSSPTLMKTSTGENVLISIKFNYEKDITQSDDIRNHVQILSLLNANQRVDLAYQYNITLPEEKLNVLASTALLSPESFGHALNILKEWDKHSDDMNVNFEKIGYSKTLFSSISKTSQQHWGQLLSGETPQAPVVPDNKMTAKQEAVYQPAAKRYAAAQRLQVAATSEFESAKQEITEIVSNFGEPRKMDSNFDLVKVGARKEFDMSRAVGLLSRSGVDPAHYSDVIYDIDALVKDAQNRGVDVEKYRSFGKANKEKVIGTLEAIGVEKEKFDSSANHIHFTGQTRGGVYERVAELSEKADSAIQQSVSDIAPTIFSSLVDEQESEKEQPSMEML